MVPPGSEIPLPVRKYYESASGVIVEESQPQDAAASVSVPCSCRPQAYQPSTVINVISAGQKPPTSNSSSSASVGRSRNWQREIVRNRTDDGRAQVTNPVRTVAQVLRQPVILSAGLSAVGHRPSQRVQNRTEMPASFKQAMTERKSSATRASNRESVPVLQQFAEELQQMAGRTGNCPSSSGQSVVRPTAIKPVPITRSFHPLMSSRPLMQQSTVAPSMAPNASGQSALPVFRQALNQTAQNRSTERDFASTNRSPVSSQPNASRGPLSRSSDTWYRYIPVNQFVSISQSMPCVSPDRSSVDVWRPPSGDSGNASLQSPARSSREQHVPVPSWSTAHRSPVRSHRSPDCRSQQHGICSPLDCGSPTYSHLLQQSPQTQMLAPVVNLASPRHLTPEKRAGISSPRKSFSPVYSQQGPPYSTVSPYSVRPQIAASGVHLSEASPPRQVSLGLVSSVASQYGRVSKPDESSERIILQLGEGSPPNPISVVGSPSDLNSSQHQPLSTFSSPLCSTMSLAILSDAHRSGFCQSSDIGLDLNFSAPSSVKRSSAGLRHFRFEAPGPAVAVVPPLPPAPPRDRQRFATANKNHITQQNLRQNRPVLPPAYSRQQSVNNRSKKAAVFPQPSSMTPMGHFRLSFPQESTPVTVFSNINTTLSSVSFGATVSPSKFFQPDSILDFDAHIGKPVGLPKKQSLAKSEQYPTTSATLIEAAKSSKKSQSSQSAGVKRPLDWTSPPSDDDLKSRFKKSQSSQSAGVKRTLDWTSPPSDDDLKPRFKKSQSALRAGMKRMLDWTNPESDDLKLRCDNFADKYQESICRRSLFDKSEYDPVANKVSECPPLLSKESKVCYCACYFAVICKNC